MTFCRDIKDTTVGTLSQQITNQLLGLKGLDGKLQDMHSYLQQVGVKQCTDPYTDPELG